MRDKKHIEKPIWALIVSLMLHPLFMTSYAVALLFAYTDFKYIFSAQFFHLLLQVSFFSIIVPLICLYFYRRAGFISDFSLNKKGESFLPFATITISYSMLFYFFYKGKLYDWFLAMLLVPIVLCILWYIIRHWWNVSMHMVAIGGLLGSVFAISYYIKNQNPYQLFIILIILVGLLAVARLILKKNVPVEIYTSFLLGLLVSFGIILLEWYYPIIYLLTIY